ncbi:organic cation/carnitine transporter 2-like isoform X6 [Heterodontus francisci]|uniref:organic cation/carnitine transporter 2-like isoform X6 n=1 Tax=Heterodontus francisci TaxID=7792 RepID=UPI00355B8CF8
MRDYDEIIAFLGEWGPFQKIVFCLLSLSVLPNGFCGLSIVFVGDIPEHRCLVPGNLNLSEAWRNRTIPLVQEGDKLQYSKCRRYRVDVIMNLSETFPDPDSFNMSEVEQEPCLDGWEYSKDQYISTIVTEWDLVCNNDWKGPFVASVFFVGVLVGSFISGQLSDRIRTSWEICSGFVRFTRNLYSLCTRLHDAASACILPTKLEDVAFRPVSRWPAVCSFVVLEDMKAKRKQSYSIIHLFKTHNMRAITIISFLVWMILTTEYFGLSLNTANLHGDDYLNCFFAGAVEVPAYVAAWLFLWKFPRRLSLSGSLFLGGLALFFIQLIPSNLSVLGTVLVMIGKFGTTCAFSIVYVYTAELYATPIRNMGVGVSSMASRLGSITSPYIFYLGVHHEFLPYNLMGIFTILSAILVLFLPETLNAPLPDTLGQMQKIKWFKCRNTPRNNDCFYQTGTFEENNMVVSKKEDI